MLAEYERLHTSHITEDQSDNGCHASDGELRELLDFLNRNSILDGQWACDYTLGTWHGTQKIVRYHKELVFQTHF